MRILLMSFIVVIFSFSALAKRTSAPEFNVEKIKRIKIKDRIFKKKIVKKGKKIIPRKVASSMTFTAADLKSDIKVLGQQWQAAKTPDQLEALMTKAIAEAPKKSTDFQILAGMFKVQQQLRGIIWRMRPLFEKTLGESGNISGNSISHISAIQMLRLISTGISDYIPNPQAGAYFDYLNIPRKDMEPSTHQFRRVMAFQAYLTNDVVPVLHENALKLTALYKANPEAVYVFDNQWTFGPNTFPDAAKRYSGIGQGELNLIISSHYRTIHDFYVFSSRNQDALINIAGKLGEGVGVDAFGLKRVFSTSELGLTDRERMVIIKSAIDKDKFLQLNPNGKELLKAAYTSLASSVAHYNESYNYFQMIPEGQKRAMPSEIKTNNERALKNMVQVIEGRTQLKEPLTGKVVTLDISPFYLEPAKSLSGLLPTKFERGKKELAVTSNGGKKLLYRNYNFGRSVAWNNSAWASIIPSAKGKGPDYMMEAKRVITASGGVFSVFALPSMFVR